MAGGGKGKREKEVCLPEIAASIMELIDSRTCASKAVSKFTGVNWKA
jgi:hypothetical protein